MACPWCFYTKSNDYLDDYENRLTFSTSYQSLDTRCKSYGIGLFNAVNAVAFYFNTPAHVLSATPNDPGSCSTP